jgi:hypothetical protein
VIEEVKSQKIEMLERRADAAKRKMKALEADILKNRAT